MLLTDPIFLGILIFGIWTSYTDIKNGKIKNLTVFLILIFGLGINLYLGTDILRMLLNSLISLIIAYLLWDFDFWSPGDAKLFFAFTFLFPIKIYELGIISYFPSYVILINTFVPVAVFSIFYSIIKLKPRFLKEKINESFSPSSISSIVVFIVGFSALFQVINILFDVNINRIFQIILMLVIAESLNKFKKLYFNIFSILIIILSIIISPFSILSIDFLINLLYTFLLFQILRLLLVNLDEFLLKKEVHIENLKPGMILGEHIIKRDGEYVKYNRPIVTYFDFIRTVRKKFSAKFTGKLSEEDVNKIQSLRKKDKLKFDKIKISKTIPFAPFIFIGMVLTYLLRGSISTILAIIIGKIGLYLNIIYYKLLIEFGLI